MIVLYNDLLKDIKNKNNQNKKSKIDITNNVLFIIKPSLRITLFLHKPGSLSIIYKLYIIIIRAIGEISKGTFDVKAN